MRIWSFIRRRGKMACSPFAAAAFTAAVLGSLGTAGLSSAFAESANPAGSAPASASGRKPIAAVRPEPLAEHRLVYKFQANQDVHMPLSVDSRIFVQKGPVTTTTTNKSTVERHFHVASVDADGSAIVDLFIDNVELSYAYNNSPPIAYSAKQAGPPPRGFEAVKKSIGPHGRVRFSAQGHVLPLPGAAPEPATDPSESFLDLLPAKPVHVGDEWFDDIKVKVMISRELTQKITLRRRYTLESVNGNVATIHLQTAEITQVEEPQVRAQLVQRTPEGKITFDLQRGAIVSRELNCSRTETGVMGEGSMIAATTHWKGSLR
jgi:Family of unknown function (DUF6263)